MISNILKIYRLIHIFRNVSKTVFQELAQELNTASENLCLPIKSSNKPAILTSQRSGWYKMKEYVNSRVLN